MDKSNKEDAKVTIDNYLDSHYIHRSNWLRAAVGNVRLDSRLSWSPGHDIRAQQGRPGRYR